MKKQLEVAEEKLRTSLKSTKEKESDSDDGSEILRRKDSNDSFDDFFDRTGRKANDEGPALITYESLKQKMSVLIGERDAIARELRQDSVESAQKDDEDELDKFMVGNDEKLRKDKLNRLSTKLNEVTAEIQKTSEHLSLAKPMLLAPADRIEAKVDYTPPVVV